MGLFGSLFGNSSTDRDNERKDIPWIPLTAVEQLEDIVAKSKGKPQLIFKHSVTCGISRMVLGRFRAQLKACEDRMDFHFLDLHAYRDVSNAVALQFQVLHQSPQVLILKNGTVVAHDSHGAITQMDLEKYL
ncbi:MAG: bacillithiol system redox-active protein YtxJ [Bacteroidota bacterium]